MREVLVNALSVTNPSGLHVVRGHLGQAITALQDRIRFAVLCRKDCPLRAGLGDRVDWVFAPGFTRHWALRSAWERTRLPGLVRERGTRAYFTPSGFAACGLGIPQIVFCQNPWALVSEARYSRDAVKAWLQRRAYRDPMRRAEVMVFNSEYMRQAYRQNADCHEKRSIIAYQAADEETRLSSEQWKNRPRKPGQIVCVSAMAPHKNVEALIRAFAKLASSATLHLVGSWPDAKYEEIIRTLVASLGLVDRVHFDGFVSREELDRLYAESQVFCLMSRCESFGIPAIEAQTFGTPVVSSSVCAIPEICGNGGFFCDPDEVPAVTAALQTLIGNPEEWQRRSALARANANRFIWEEVSRPLVEVFAGFAD